MPRPNDLHTHINTMTDYHEEMGRGLKEAKEMIHRIKKKKINKKCIKHF